MLSFLAVLLGFELERDHKNNKKSHTDTVVLENLNGDAISTSVTEYTYGNNELCTVLHSDFRKAPYVQELGINYEDDDGDERQLRMKVGMMERVITDGTDPTATVAAITSVDGQVSVVLDESGDIWVKRGDASFDTEFVCDVEERRRLQDHHRRLFQLGPNLGSFWSKSWNIWATYLNQLNYLMRPCGHQVPSHGVMDSACRAVHEARPGVEMSLDMFKDEVEDIDEDH